MTWAATHTTSLASLTLINIGVMPGYRWHFLARIWRTPVLGEIFMATTTRFGFKTLSRIGNPRGLPADMINRTYDHFDSRTRQAVLRLYRATNDVGALSERCGNILKPLDLPTLVIWGRADPYLSVSYAERQRDYFPKAKVVIFDDSGHWPFADNPEGVASEVVPFIKTCMSA